MAHDNKHSSHHYILSTKAALSVFGALLVLTIITVGIAKVDLGTLNFPVAMLVASIKACLVAIIFMNLKHDKVENAVIFVTSFLFLAIFIVFTGADLFFRGDVYVTGNPLKATVSGPAKFKKAWISTPELVAHGKTVYAAQCVTCHGDAGLGNGPAGASLNPPPRNFTADSGWKNGRKPTGVFKTLKEGIPGTAMASYATLSLDDRWGLVHYVLSLGPAALADEPADFQAVGIDPTKEDGGAGGADAQKKSIPIQLAMERMAETAQASEIRRVDAPTDHPGAAVYQAKCASCHGASGEGARVTFMGSLPKAVVQTQPLSSYESIGSAERFNQVVIHGLPGNLMPGNGSLSGGQLRDLHGFVGILAR